MAMLVVNKNNALRGAYKTKISYFASSYDLKALPVGESSALDHGFGK